MFNSKVTDRKRGAFRDWKEDDEVAEIFLPLPANTIKKEITCTITATSLHVEHIRLGKTLLKAEPLAGLVNEEESTWYLQGTSVLIICLAKQQAGANKSEQYWGATLAAEGGAFECYKSPDDVEHARAARERLEAKAEEQRKARVTASEKALREKEEEQAREEAKALRRRRAREEAREAEATADDDDDRAAARRRAAAAAAAMAAPQSEPWYGDWSWVWMGLLLALVMIGGDVLLHWQQYFPEAPKIEDAEDGW
jgi:chemotaxis protein histidine kinase CheA